MPSTSGGAANSSYALLFLLPHLPSSPTFFSSSLTSTFAVHLATLFSHLDYYNISPIVFPLPFLLHLLHPSILHVIAGGTFKNANSIINSPDGNLPKAFYVSSNLVLQGPAHVSWPGPLQPTGAVLPSLSAPTALALLFPIRTSPSLPGNFWACRPFHPRCSVPLLAQLTP